MPANGSEAATESRITPLSASEGKSGRFPVENKPPAPKGTKARRRRGREEGQETNEEARFFLAGPNRNGDVPALGRECVSEAEAIIDAFRERVNFYKLSEFQTRADVSQSGDPMLRKEAAKRNHPAS